MSVRFTTDIIPAEYIERFVDGATGQYGVFNCCSAVSTCSGMTVAVAAAVANGYVVNGSLGAASCATTITLCSADACNPRIDIISIDSAGVEQKNTGTAAAAPVPPNIGACELHLAQINVAAGQTVLTSCDITDMRYPLREIVIRKAADESVTCSTTLQNDDHLFFPVQACKDYQVEGGIIFRSGTTEDIKINWTAPACVTFAEGLVELPGAASDPIGCSDAVLCGAGANDRYAHLSAVIRNGSNAGTLQVQFAQNTSGATAATIKAGSVMTVRKIS